MRSKSRALNIFFALAMPLLISACDARFFAEPQPASAIGAKLEDMSSLNDDAGNDVNQIVVYDPTVSRIHQFNLANMNIERSLAVLNPGLPHTVLYNLRGNYIIDFTTKHLSVYDRAGGATHNPIRFIGTPVSAAFRPSLGVIVIYDSLMSVGMMKLNADGSVLKSWKGGPDLGNNRTIAAGDIDDGGRLILALSDGSIVKVDMDATMSSGAWTTIGAPINTGLTGIEWLAPVRGRPDQVMIATKSRMAVVDTDAGSLTNLPTSLSGSVIWRAKGLDAHILTTDYTEGGVRIYYVNGGQVLSKQLVRAAGTVTHSRLDQVANNLTFVTANSYYWRPNAAGVVVLSSRYDTEPRDRMIRQWRFSDLDALVEEKVVDDAKLALAARSLFALKTNKLGWALNYDLFSGAAPAEKRGFNVPYIP